MKEYIIRVALSAIFAAFADIIVPKEWRSYVRIVTGFLILAVLISPLAKVKDIEIFDMQESYEVSEIPVRDKVAEELSKNVTRDIEERILSEFKTEAKAEVVLEIDADHKIKGVKKIRVSCNRIPKGLDARLKEIYGCDSIEFGHN